MVTKEMTEVFRENDRHPDDPHILIIKDFEDFKLWEQRKEHDFKGILLPNAFSEEECDFISKDIIDVLGKINNSSLSVLKETNNVEDVLRRHRCHFEGLTLEKITQCCAIFKDLTDVHYHNVGIRLNSVFPDFPHIHQPVLSAIFSGDGTKFIKPDFEFTPEEEKNFESQRIPEDKYIYTVGAGDLVMFEDMWHMAGKLSDNEDTQPRTQFLIG